VEGGDGSTLSLDFTTGVLDPRLTFTRSTNATFINSQGLVEWAGANIVLQSGDLSQNGAGQWITRTNLTVSGWTGFADPFGGSTAVKIIPNTTNGLHYVGTADLSMAVGIPFTASVYVKASGYSIVGLVTTNANARAHFNLSNQTSAGYGVTNTRTITDVGGGWYRITMSFTVVNGPLVAFWVTAMNTATDPAANSFAGATGSSDGVLAWGGQINPGTSAQSYYGTTTTAYQAPRFDYDPSTTPPQPRGLLLEGSASNYGTHSESFATSGSGTLWTYSAITKNATLASSPAGNNDAAQLNETTANDIHRISQFVTAAAGAVTISVWAKAIDSSTPRRLYMNAIGFMGCGALFDLTQTGASGTAVNVAGSAANRAGTWVKYPNGWYRCSIVGTYNTGQTLYLQVNRASSTVATDDTYSGSTANGLMLYGFQTELGSGASSYIPTAASTGSRALDSCYIAGTNFTSWFSTGAGTVVAQSDNVCTVGQNTLCNFSDSTTNNQIRMGDGTGGGSNELLLTVVGNSNQGVVDSLFNPALNTAYKTAYAWDTNNFAICANGGAVATDTGGTLAGAGVITSVTIGGDFYQTSGPNSVNMKNGHIRSWKYYPTRLSNAQLQALTT
jgi:hypothetical protein